MKAPLVSQLLSTARGIVEFREMGKNQRARVCTSMHAFIQSQRDDQSFGDMRWGKWSMDSYTSRPVARWAKNRLNSAAAPHIEFKESLEEILSFMVFAQIQTCISFHEMGHACARVRSRVHEQWA